MGNCHGVRPLHPVGRETLNHRLRHDDILVCAKSLLQFGQPPRHFARGFPVSRYWSWYGDTGNLEVIEPKASREIAKWFEHHPKPLMLTEYGADTIAGMHSDPPVVFTEEYQCEMIRRVNNVLDRLDFVIGEHLWNFADFMTKQGITRIIGNRKGILTRQRQPKMIAHMLKRRWTGTGWTDRPTPGAC